MHPATVAVTVIRAESDKHWTPERSGNLQFIDAIMAWLRVSASSCKGPLKGPRRAHSPPEGAAAGLLGQANTQLRSEGLEDAARVVVEHSVRSHALYRLNASRSKREAKAIRHL